MEFMGGRPIQQFPANQVAKALPRYLVRSSTYFWERSVPWRRDRRIRT